MKRTLLPLPIGKAQHRFPQHEASSCVHHWILDSNSKGKCTKCPEERQFATAGFVAFSDTAAAAARNRWAKVVKYASDED